MKIFIINLDRSKERLLEQQQQFTQLGLEFQRLPAVSTQDFSKDQYQQMAFGGQRPLKEAELACFLSHQKAWQWVIQENQPCAILEDDAVLVQDFKAILEDISHLTQVDFINLEVHGRKKTVAKNASHHLVNQHYHLYQLFIDRSGTGGYVIFPSGAKTLLEYAQRRPIGLADEFIYGCQQLKKYQIEPAALLQSDKCPQYNVSCSIIHGSVIGQVANQHQFDLSPQQKLKFKKNRIKTQLKLGLQQLKYLLNGQKRDIVVDPTKF